MAVDGFGCLMSTVWPIHLFFVKWAWMVSILLAHTEGSLGLFIGREIDNWHKMHGSKWENMKI